MCTQSLVLLKLVSVWALQLCICMSVCICLILCFSVCVYVCVLGWRRCNVRFLLLSEVVQPQCH